MVDLLLPRHARQSPQADRKSPPKAEPKPTANTSRLLSKPSLDALLTGRVSRTLKGANNYLQSWKDGLTVEQRERLHEIEQRKQLLLVRLKNADTLKDWEAAAEELDILDGNDEWKRDDDDGNYNVPLLRNRLKALDDARASGDIHNMMHLIRTELFRDLAGLDNVDLYRHSYVGTKSLIEQYVDSAVQTIDAVVVQSAVSKDVEVRDLLEGMLLARQSFGRSALLLSGGGTFGMSHIGVLKALFDVKLLPRIISGASAGSIVCAVMCTRTDEEIPALIEEFPYGDLGVFGAGTKDSSTLDHLRRLLTEGSWSDIRHLTQVMRDLTGDMTFQEAYNRTRRILNICVSTESMYELPRLLNYVTAPNVMIWSAVAASCSLPLVFHSSPLLVKDPMTGEHRPWNPSPQHFIDGSVDGDLPMTRLSEMFNVNHFIVSQVNPHVVPFLAKDEYVPPSVRNGKMTHTHHNETDWINTFTSLAKDEALHRLQFMAEMGIMPNLMSKMQSILSQKYSGDITILPEIAMNELPRLLTNPDSEFMLRSLSQGEKATWPRLSRIRDRCSIELALDRAVHHLRTRVAFSESQRDLRKLNAKVGSLRLNQPVSLSMHPRELSDLSSASVPHHYRRRSGGSLTTQAVRQSIFDPPEEITGDETHEEERLEMVARRQPPSPSSLRKPKLKRASKSQVCVPRHTSMSASTTSFNFAKPITPPQRTAGVEMLSGMLDSDDDEDAHTWLSRGDHVVSPIDDQETSELGHSSDADVDLGTEESEVDPFDSKWESPPTKHTDDSMFGPGGRVGDGAWD